ncbi:uncharacterized protein E5676_scaffold376G001250 [Cucumis melo var. makuwa]|uniref:Uncharacterized protein n=1 Tax=Cucumis melo var. makuwa TaxID=1194695 RepID=A0A5A7TMJ4_CUCMM|nr:uncharacterized protein E6C27_scaffold44G001210 [Cucumis melo var. makuwa]TYK06026.1 uncharacterized protein E5676_scaffold376G001250 [Cucumis melo var. makuwa]
MWFRSIQRIGNTDGGGGLPGLVINTFARHFSRKRAENLRKINPKLTPQEASLVAQDLYGVIQQHGPLTVSNAWIKAQGLLFMNVLSLNVLKPGFPEFGWITGIA